MGKEETPPCRTWELMTHFSHKEIYCPKKYRGFVRFDEAAACFERTNKGAARPAQGRSAGGKLYGATVVERVTVPLCPWGPVEVVVLVQVLVTGSHCPCDVRLTLAPPGPVAVPLWV